jgi:toxin YhaV
MSLKVCNGWTIYYHPLFAKNYLALENKVSRLKATLSPKEYRRHETVRLYASIVKAIEEKIPKNPLFADFCLYNELKGYCRVKGMGIPDRYRLFFKVFEDDKLIFILWLGYPRKQGSRDDCYTVFEQKVLKGDFATASEELMQQCSV